MPKSRPQQPLQPRLFDVGPSYSPHQPDAWLDQPNVVWHSSWEAELPTRDDPNRPTGSASWAFHGDLEGMHFGSHAAAVDRRPSGFIHPRRVPSEIVLPGVHGDDWANTAPEATDAVIEGKAVAYQNEYEGKHGEVSIRVRPEAVKSWNQDVLDNPHAPQHWKDLAKTHALVSTGNKAKSHEFYEQGSFWPHVVEDMKGVRPDKAGRTVGTPKVLSFHETYEEAEAAAKVTRDIEESKAYKNKEHRPDIRRYDINVYGNTPLIPVTKPGKIRLTPKDEVWKDWS